MERDRKERDADANRAKFGRTKADKDMASAEEDLRKKKLDAAKREDAGDDDDEPTPA